MTMPMTDSFPPGGPLGPGEPLRPGEPPRPGEPFRPGPPGRPDPGHPGRPGPGWPEPGRQPATPPQYPAVSPARGWLDRADWPGQVYQRLLEQRIVLASGCLDDESATMLCAQLLTLDAEGDGPVRLELQGLDAELPAALTVMGVLDVLRVAVTGYVAGRVSGPALGVLAACPHRRGYPSAMLALAEPTMRFDGTASAVSGQEEQVRAMLDTLYIRLAEVTGREVDEIRADARQGVFLSVTDAVSYGLLEGEAERPAPGRGSHPAGPH